MDYSEATAASGGRGWPASAARRSAMARRACSNDSENATIAVSSSDLASTSRIMVAWMASISACNSSIACMVAAVRAFLVISRSFSSAPSRRTRSSARL